MVARIGLSGDQLEPRDAAWAGRLAALVKETVSYFQAKGVRVVNMSWGWGLEELERNLRDHGNPNPEEEARAALAILDDALFEALSEAEDILFICGAGNSGEAVAEWIPTRYELPNLLAVGAVDERGRPTAFTSFGPRVRLHARGRRVEGPVPGGKWIPRSGTSMAAPQVTGAASKLLAIEADLSPAEVIERLLNTAERCTTGERTLRVLNPRRLLGR